MKQYFIKESENTVTSITSIFIASRITHPDKRSTTKLMTARNQAYNALYKLAKTLYLCDYLPNSCSVMTFVHPHMAE